LTFFQR